MNLSTLLLLPALLSIPAANLSAEAPASEAVDQVLQQLDAEFDNAFSWWAKVWDPATGGCFYSLSAKEAAAADPRFGPDIESISKLVSVLRWTDLMEEAPEEFKARTIKHLQGLQDPESSMFGDPQHADQYTHYTSSRVTEMAINTIERLGGEALYPPPMEKTAESEKAAAHFAHLQSPTALEAWLADLPWNRATWTVGGRLRAESAFFADLPADRKDAMLAVVKRFAVENQRENGFWGSDDEGWAARLSGTYKIASFCDIHGIEIPRAKEMTATLIDHLYNSKYDNSIVLYNTANLLNILHQHGAGFDLQQRIEMVRRCTEILHTMRAPDGGFVTHNYRPTPIENGKLLGKEVVESNSNATGLAHSTRKLLIELLTGDPGPTPHRNGGDLIQGLRDQLAVPPHTLSQSK